MPDLAGMTLPEFSQWFQNLLQHPQPVPAASFFESRVTHTPGMTGAVPPGTLGLFDPNTDPVAQVKASNLPESVKAKLIEQWQKSGKGFITVGGQDVFRNRPDTIRHEQIHALQQGAGKQLDPHGAEIAASLSPAVTRYLDTDPVYVAEQKRLGRQYVHGHEGLAVDLTDTSIPSNEKLRAMVSNWLGPKEQKQLKQLSEHAPPSTPPSAR